MQQFQCLERPFALYIVLVKVRILEMYEEAHARQCCLGLTYEHRNFKIIKLLLVCLLEQVREACAATSKHITRESLSVF